MEDDGIPAPASSYYWPSQEAGVGETVEMKPKNNW